MPSSSSMLVAKVDPPGAEITVPLGQIDDAWSPQHWDALHLAIPDGPQPDELAIVLALATSGRPHFRVGDHRPATSVCQPWKSMHLINSRHGCRIVIDSALLGQSAAIAA